MGEEKRDLTRTHAQKEERTRTSAKKNATAGWEESDNHNSSRQMENA
jgi:hypothetical protein